MSALSLGQNIRAIIDIGTTKICVLVARSNPDGSCTILGIGKAPSYGLKKGVVVDVLKTVHSIKRAIYDAQLNAGTPIKRVSIGISGSHIHSVNSEGGGPIVNRCITQDDVNRVLQSAKAIPISEGEQILHVIPKYFTIDGQEHVESPIGMYGSRLEIKTHVILARVAAVHNLVACCHRAGIIVEDIVLEQLASAQAVLTKDECSLGVALLDIGGGTSDIAVYRNGSIIHTAVLPVAGNHFTNDIAIGLRATREEAERIKKEFGVASREFLHETTEIEIKLADNQHKAIRTLDEVVTVLEPRAKELFRLVYQNLEQKQHLASITSGLVVTGGGSLLGGLAQVAQQIFNVPVRIGRPHIEHESYQVLSSPVYATAYGLLLRLLKKQELPMYQQPTIVQAKNIISRMRNWLSIFF